MVGRNGSEGIGATGRAPPRRPGRPRAAAGPQRGARRGLNDFGPVLLTRETALTTANAPVLAAEARHRGSRFAFGCAKRQDASAFDGQPVKGVLDSGGVKMWSTGRVMRSC